MDSLTRKQAIDEVHRRIGRNLLRFQGIEVSLRFVLPYMTSGNDAKSKDSDRGKQHSLRGLLKQYRPSLVDMPDLWEGELERLLRARNELVHEFYQNPRFDLLSADVLPNALAYLDAQYKQAEDWAEMIRVQSLVILLLLMESNPSVAAEFGSHREKLLAQLPRSVELIHSVRPEQTAWVSTRVVRLLRLAELHTDQVEGMTLLSRAGRYIATRAPDLNFKEVYGLKTLKEVLLTSGLFEVSVAADGTTVRYRSKGALASLPLDDEDPTALSVSIIRGR